MPNSLAWLHRPNYPLALRVPVLDTKTHTTRFHTLDAL